MAWHAVEKSSRDLNQKNSQSSGVSSIFPTTFKHVFVAIRWNFLQQANHAFQRRGHRDSGRRPHGFNRAVTTGPLRPTKLLGKDFCWPFFTAKKHGQLPTRVTEMASWSTRPEISMTICQGLEISHPIASHHVWVVLVHYTFTKQHVTTGPEISTAKIYHKVVRGTTSMGQGKGVSSTGRVLWRRGEEEGHMDDRRGRASKFPVKWWF